MKFQHSPTVGENNHECTRLEGIYIDEDEKIKEVTPIYNVYNGQYENQECLFLTEDGLYEVLMQVKTIRYSTVTTYIK
ncbi:hypothetical protein [Paraclostridium bifermentans]|uniref:hypothetical protein n=1 Tax=Paraclostridium bifermentans TaxID=1490 RepID=UPI001A9AE7EB|nr:hypothetical protein [Paraclostridium bifermentans]